MIEINFFEEKKKNNLNQILVVIFIVLLLIVVGFVFLSRTYYTKSIENDENYLATNSEQIALSREMSQLNQVANASAGAQETIVSNRYPMNIILTEIIALIPNQQNMVNTLQITKDTNQVSLILENITAEEAQSIVSEMETLSYINNVQLLSAVANGEAANQMQYTLTMTLNTEGVVTDEVE